MTQKTMKLSEAIRLGALLHEQGFRRYAAYDDRGEIQYTCALGAALEAIGVSFGVMQVGLDLNCLPKGWEILELYVPCPHCEYCASLFSVIIHLNDEARWTRERIADWVATMESAESGEELDGLEVGEVEELQVT